MVLLSVAAFFSVKVSPNCPRRSGPGDGHEKGADERQATRGNVKEHRAPKHVRIQSVLQILDHFIRIPRDAALSEEDAQAQGQHAESGPIIVRIFRILGSLRL